MYKYIMIRLLHSIPPCRAENRFGVVPFDVGLRQGRLVPTQGAPSRSSPALRVPLITSRSAQPDCRGLSLISSKAVVYGGADRRDAEVVPLVEVLERFDRRDGA